MVSIHEIEKKIGHQLSDEQVKILEHDNKHPLSIVACAGSGKTTTIETKMIYNILNRDIDAKDILCVTFSKKAQEDMNEKYDELYRKITEEEAFHKKPHFSTFHSLFKFLIDEFVQLSYIDVVTSYQKYQSELMRALNYKSQSGLDLRIILEEIFSYYGVVINTLQSKDGIKGINEIPKGYNFTLKEYRQVIDQYQRLKREDMAIDFDDMQVILYDILMSTKILNKNIARSIIEYFNEQYKHVYIDEFQDISTIQNSILDLLLDENYYKLIVVGDDDQSIYKFRGSDPQFILNFKDDIPNAEVLLLSTNYRCKKNILNPSSFMINSNQMRFDKSIQAFNKGGLLNIISDDQLSTELLKVLRHNLNNKKDETFAVLCRHNIQLSLIADLFTHYDIPVKLNRSSETNLQSNFLYEDLINTIRAIKFNDLDAFKNVSHKIFMFMSKKNTFSIIENAKKQKSHWFEIAMYGNYWHSSNTLHIKSMKDSIEQVNSALLLIQYAYELIEPYYKMLEEKKQSSQLSTLKMIKNHIINLLETTPNLSFDKFIEKEEEKKDQLFINDMIDDGLTLITFHASKGLEFDNVYIINANHMVTPGTSRLSSYIIENDITSLLKAFEDLEEERRLFYVACTRAKNKLAISYIGGKQSIFVEEIQYKQHLNLSNAIRNNNNFAKLMNQMSQLILESNANQDIKLIAKNLLGKYLNQDLIDNLKHYGDSTQYNFSKDVHNQKVLMKSYEEYL